MRKQTRLWTCRDGSRIRICDMADDHLVVCIAMLRAAAKAAADVVGDDVAPEQLSRIFASLSAEAARRRLDVPGDAPGSAPGGVMKIPRGADRPADPRKALSDAWKAVAAVPSTLGDDIYYIGHDRDGNLTCTCQGYVARRAKILFMGLGTVAQCRHTRTHAERMRS